MRPIFIPDLARARKADWAPGPGVLVLKDKFSYNESLTQYPHLHQEKSWAVITLLQCFYFSGDQNIAMHCCLKASKES